MSTTISHRTYRGATNLCFFIISILYRILLSIYPTTSKRIKIDVEAFTCKWECSAFCHFDGNVLDDDDIENFLGQLHGFDMCVAVFYFGNRFVTIAKVFNFQTDICSYELIESLDSGGTTRTKCTDLATFKFVLQQYTFSRVDKSDFELEFDIGKKALDSRFFETWVFCHKSNQ